MNRDKPHCITSFFYFYLVASIHQLAGYELYTLSLSILSHNESLIGHMLCIINMCDINTSLINLSRRVYRRSEEHTSELQSRFDLVCRLLLEKKKTYNSNKHHL